jgi:Sulfotransferase family
LAHLDGLMGSDVTVPADDPVIVLASGWRTGSTLAGRLITSSGDILMWGEPYHLSEVVPSITTALSHTGTDSLRPAAIVSSDGYDLDRLEHQWIATLFPEPADLVEAYRDLLRRLLAKPAAERGFAGWGFKEVRLDATDAIALRYLFPRARMVLLVRDPHDAWASYRATGRRWQVRRDDLPVAGPWRYGRLWRRLAQSFLDEADALGAMLLRMEDLADPAVVDRLEAYLGVRFDRSVLDIRVGSTAIGRSRRSWLITVATWPTARRLGYPLRADGTPM